MHPRRDFHFAREEEINGFARFMIVLGYLKVMPFSPLIPMALAILERMYLKTREMRNSSIRCLKTTLTIMIYFAFYCSLRSIVVAGSTHHLTL